jgi:Type II restriction endonuclease EcoO109I
MGAVERVRQASGVETGRGPDDERIALAITNFVDAFDYWYIRVIREAVPQYRKLIVSRINPFIRRIECDLMSAEETADRLVEDWNRRNFVTAGGWAIEALAVSGRSEVRKSGIAGIDLDRYDAEAGEYHLCVLKSGTVTRNSDIVNALKRSSRAAEKQLRQSQTTKGVQAKYAIAAGKTSSTFEDGVWRPSSGEFWGEMFDLPTDDAVELALAIAAEAGAEVRRDADEHLGALVFLVADYISRREARGVVDWEFIARRNMQSKPSWREEDERRHLHAVSCLERSGYVA